MDISVALCTYNGEDYLPQQLSSILSQSITPNEIVVRDDGSTDETMNILHKFASKNPNIFDIKRNATNKGIVKNFEAAIRACSGDYIALSDQDDVWHESKIERQIEVHDKSDVALVCHNSTLVSESLIQIDDFWSKLNHENRPQKTLSPTEIMIELIYQNFVQGATIMIDSEWKDELLPIPKIWQHDYYMAIQAALKSGIIALDEELILYRQHGSQEVGGIKQNIFNRFFANFGLECDDSRISKWELIYEQINNYHNAEMAPNKQIIEQLLDRKISYEKRRNAVHCDNSFPHKILNIKQNLVSGAYSEFGCGIWSVLNDTGTSILSPFRS
jgi:glycosyltransferase involved in cell wall biosynthesis